MRALQAEVGTAIVGVDDGRRKVQSLSAEGFYPELNIAYGIDEFAGHDPLLPQAYFRAITPGQGKGGLGLFLPSVNSVAEARELGISWLLLPPNRAAPAGTTYVTTLAGQRLFYVPDSSQFSVQPSAEGVVTSVAQPFAGTYDLAVHDAGPVTLVARVTDVPGWHASIDGKAAVLRPFDGIMQSLAVPDGTHEIRMWYEPGTLLDGGLVAVAGALGLVVFGCVVVRRRATRRPEAIEDGVTISSELEAMSVR